MWPLLLSLLGILVTQKDGPTHSDPCFLQVDNGKVGCVGDIQVTCEVSCNGEYQGRYHCSHDKGWKEKLPYCVKQTKDLSNIAICPDKEVYSECQGHCERSCSDWNKPAACSPKVCVGACVCGKGLVRGPDGKCVSADSCSGTIGLSSDSEVTAGYFGCPYQEKCDEYCKMSQYMTKLRGHCVGPHNFYCTCTSQ